MNKLIQILERSRNWLESEGLGSLLSEPFRPPRYEAYAGCRVVMLALDVSPSMEFNDYHPTRLEGAKRAVRRYLDAIAIREPQTLVGIVDFHGEAALVSHPLSVAERKQELQHAMHRLHTGLGTNIGAGLELAARELARVPSAVNPTTILLTDGASNQGPDPLKVATHNKAGGMQLDIIGIGGSPAAVNETELKRMASVINGQPRYWFIESADALVERFEALALREIR